MYIGGGSPADCGVLTCDGLNLLRPISLLKENNKKSQNFNIECLKTAFNTKTSILKYQRDVKKT